MAYSPMEMVSHVARRLGIGSPPRLLEQAGDPATAIELALDLSSAPADPPLLPPPADLEAGRGIEQLAEPIGFWMEQMVRGPRPIEERLVWFWHDHFATSLVKVRVPYLMWQQHLILRRHAAGSFAELLHAISKDPAMLVYLDGAFNRVDRLNENFGREVMELFTIGRGHYSQDDVVAAARSFTGWTISVPGLRTEGLGEPWTAMFVPRFHDAGEKTLLGVTGAHDMDDALDILLHHPATPERVASKLYTELVGIPPDEPTARPLGATFGTDYQIMPLVENIVSQPAFLAEEPVRARVRTPLEKTVGLMQGFGTARGVGRQLFQALRTIGYLPFAPPHVGGFPKDTELLGPFQLIHTFDLVAAVPQPVPDLATDELFARLGLFDVSDGSREVVDGQSDPALRLALALNAPEYALS